MKKLLAILLTLALLCAGLSALAEGAPELKLGYLAPYRPAGARASLCADAFAHAAQRQGVSAVIVRYSGVDAAEAADAPAEDPALTAMRSLIDEGVDGAVIVPETLEQAVALAELAHDAGVPVVVEGLSMAPAYPIEPDPETARERPFVANVLFSDGEAAYLAAKWLEDASDSPLLFHCALPEGGEDIRAGLDRALAEAQYLSLADELAASADTAEAGVEALHQEINSATMFYCILADSAPLASGCAAVLGGDAEVLIAALTDAPDALRLFDEGVDMLAGVPASLEAVRSYKALVDYLRDGASPLGENHVVELPICIATPGDASGWIDSADAEAACDLLLPDGPAE